MPKGPFKLVRPDAVLAVRGLAALIGGPEVVAPGATVIRSPEIQGKIEAFLAYAQSIKLDITRQMLAMDLDQHGRERISGMALWVPSPGRTAMFFTPPPSEFPDSAAAIQAALGAALEEARGHGVVLVQTMLEPGDGAGKTVFAGADFHQLATLTYMERKPPVHPPLFDLPLDYSLQPYSAATHGHLREAVLESYEQTLDCPALAGLRDIDDIIEGHKAVGDFDPQLWSVLMRFGKPVGCLLLADIAGRNALELVYLGLAPGVRGQGLGRILMQRVLAIASRRHFAVATLAVDAANLPATKLYRRCGYASVAQRVAMIKKLV